jgi:hypothetical protein
MEDDRQLAAPAHARHTAKKSSAPSSATSDRSLKSLEEIAGVKRS